MNAFANLLLSSYVSVEHFQPNVNNTQEFYASDASLQAVHVNIQPSSAYEANLYGGAYGKTYTLFTTTSGILETDRLTTVSGTGSVKQYIVKGRQHFDYGLGQHDEIYIEEVV